MQKGVIIMANMAILGVICVFLSIASYATLHLDFAISDGLAFAGAMLIGLAWPIGFIIDWPKPSNSDNKSRSEQ